MCYNSAAIPLVIEQRSTSQRRKRTGMQRILRRPGMAIIALIVIVIGALPGPSLVRSQPSPTLPQAACGVTLEPFPIPAGHTARRPQIVYFPPYDEMYVAVTSIDPTVPNPYGWPAGISYPTLWTIRPWQQQVQHEAWLEAAPADPLAHPVNLDYYPVGIEQSIIVDDTGAPVLDEHGRLQYEFVLSDRVLMQWIRQGATIYQTTVWPYQRARGKPWWYGTRNVINVFGGGEIRGTIIPNPDRRPSLVYLFRDPLTTALDEPRGGWGYLYYQSLLRNKHPLVLRWLVREQLARPLETTVIAPREAPAIATSGSNVAYAALSEVTPEGGQRIGLWRFDPSVIEHTGFLTSQETDLAWRRWGMLPGEASHPTLGMVGETMLLTYRAADGRPMLAWTQTSAPDGWQTIALDTQMADRAIDLIIDEPRQRYLAVWARRTVADDPTQNQLVIMQGLLTNPAVRTLPVAMTAPGPWYDPQGAIRSNGMVHIVADGAPPDEPVRPYLLTLPAWWDGPITVPALPVNDAARSGRLAWDAGVTPPESLTLRLEHSTERVDISLETSTTVTLPSTPLPAGPALVSLAWPECDGLPIGGIAIQAPPTAQYEDAALDVAPTNPLSVRLRLGNATTETPLHVVGTVRIIAADDREYRLDCTMALMASGDGTLRGACALPARDTLPDGAATIILEGMLTDAFGQRAITDPLDRALLALTATTRYVSFVPSMVFVPVVTR